MTHIWDITFIVVDMNFHNQIHKQSVYLPKRMCESDLVIMYMGHNSMDHFYLKKGDIFQNKYGAFHHDDMIGQFFGTKVLSRISDGWIYAMEPSPELWSMGLHVSDLNSSVGPLPYILL